MIFTASARNILDTSLYVKNSYQSFHPKTEFVSYKAKGSPYTAGVREERVQMTGTERTEVTGGRTEVHNEELYGLYCL
jgi:hypothetical protein